MNRVKSILNELEAEQLIGQGRYSEALPVLLDLLENKELVNRESVLNDISSCYLNDKNFRKAIYYLEKLIVLNPMDSNAMFNLAFCYYALRDYQEAVICFERLKSANPDRDDILYNLGMSYLELGNSVKALETFEEVLKFPHSSAVIYNIGIALVNKDLPERARDFLTSYLSSASQDIDATFGLGIAYSKLSEHRKAIECFSRVIRWDPKRYISAYVSLGISYLQIGDIEKSMEFLKKALEFNPEMPEAWYYLGVFYETTGQPEMAIASLQKAVEFDSTMVEAWEKLGNHYLRKGKRKESIENYKKALFLSNIARYSFKLGLISMLELDYQNAVKYFRECMNKIENENLKPSKADDFEIKDIYENLAVCYYYLQRYEEASESGRKFLKMDYSKEFLFFITGSSFMKTGKFREARTYLEKAVNIKPDDINALFSLGILEGNMGNYSESAVYLEKAVSIQRNPEIVYALALSKMKTGEFDAAITLFDEYMQSHNEEPETLYKLGLLYIEMKSYSKARAAFEKTLLIDPDFKKAKEFLDSIENNKLPRDNDE